MKVKVLLPFNDKFNLTRAFNPGEIVDFEEARAKNIVDRKLGEFVEDQKAKKEPKVEEPLPPVTAEAGPEIVDEPKVGEAIEPKRRKRKNED